jgi:hypothetical protein
MIIHGNRVVRCAFQLAIVLVYQLNPASAQEQPYYFYHGRDYGTEALYSPIGLVINSGFGILQYGNRSRNVFDIRFANGWKNVTWNIGHPFRAIREYGGWGAFLGDEVYPASLSKNNAQYWPNYQNHLVGGGMDFVEVCEWFRFHGFANPKLYGAVSMMVSHLLNEVVENDAYVGSNVDPIADLYIFNPLGMLLFSIDDVAKFFSETLNMASWPGQPTYSPWTRTLENHGLNYSIKWRPPFSQRWSIFYYWGLTGLIGASYARENGDNVSIGAGLRGMRLIDASDGNAGRKLTAQLTWNVGLFYDRNNSLLGSLFVSGISDYRVHANLYPGVLRFGRISPGLFIATSTNRRVIAGVSVNVFPIGIAARSSSQ